jgi:hypothetical protein
LLTYAASAASRLQATTAANVPPASVLRRAVLPEPLVNTTANSGAAAKVVVPGGSQLAHVTAPAPEPPKFKTTSWPEADRLFHRDPNWMGADAASSVDLGKGRVLWLFGDSYIANTPNHVRTESTFIRNSIAIQTGRNPATADMQFFWRKSSKGTATSFFSGAELTLQGMAGGNEWSWPGAGVRVGNSVVLFLTQIRSSNASPGFEVAGSRAVRIPNPEDPPDAWRIEELTPPTMPPNVHLAAAVSSEGRYVMGYAFRERVRPPTLPPSAPALRQPHALFLARWPKDAFERGEIGTPEWSTGEGWSRDVADAAPILKNGSTELTASRIPGTGTSAPYHIEMQTFGANGRARVGVRVAESAAGPWSKPSIVFRPPEASLPDIAIYAAKLHPELTGAQHVATYCTNTRKQEGVVNENDLYYPRFIRLEEVQ